MEVRGKGEVGNYAFDVLKQYMLEHFPDCKVTGKGKEITKRCHYCGDSRNKNSRHLYIGINNSGTISYHCFKCNAGGLVGYKFFRDIGVYDYDLINTVVDANKNTLNGKEPFDFRGAMEKMTYFPAPVWEMATDDRSFKKLDYINKRMGTTYTLEDMSKLKIVLNLQEFLHTNGYDWYTRHPTVVAEMDVGFLGFLSVDNSHINMRRLVPEEKVHESLRERYTNYAMKSHDEYGVIYYTIPGTVNAYMPANIVLTEGPFDILGVYTHLPRFRNGIYCSVGGKTNYCKAIDYILYRLRVPMMGSVVHIFSDNDVNQKDIATWRSYAQRKDIEMKLHFNLYTGEKDYGVRADHIIDSINDLYTPGGYRYEDYSYDPYRNHVNLNGFNFEII